VMGNQNSPDVGIQDDQYIRRRLAPLPGDPDYLHLADLIQALDRERDGQEVIVLDYGCGGSPYRSLFPNADYRRADFGEMEELDYAIGHDSKIAEADATFDLVLSTQVAEHVMDPSGYFKECARLLKPGGRLICTTHGTYPDHGCPYDFQRWTADGLARDIKAAGFEIESVFKLTTNGRALMYLIQRFSGWFDTPSGVLSPMLRVMRSVMHRSPAMWQRTADKAFPRNRVVEASAEGHEFYLGLMVSARRS
jgi:SAM-dependent methyltransferase